MEAARMAMPDVARRKLTKLVLAIFTTFCLLGGASAQSTDPDRPAPLGPGLNRGNVDNSGQGHTFFLFAGPGHFDVEMAFEEMGLFGSPLRQAMNFDFYTDDDKLTSHNTIVSQGDLARNHTDGDFTSRQRLRLVVTAQQLPAVSPISAEPGIPTKSLPAPATPHVGTAAVSNR
jgi:hypothetical protein